MRAINMMISNYNFRKGDASRIRYIVIHYTAGFGTAKDNCRYFASGKKGRSAHYVVGYEGEIWQSIEDENIAWHCGARHYEHAECRNANSLGIELCVRKKDHSHLKAGDKDWYFEDATVEAAVELTRYLMDKYNVPAANVLRHYDVTGKVCPAPYVHNTTKHTWQEFKNAIGGGKIDWIGLLKDILSAICKALGEMWKRWKPDNPHMTRIMGRPQVGANRIAAYIASKNPSAAWYAKRLADTYIEEGIYEGVRGDIAAAQAMLETGNLTFKGSAVTPDQNNFCGLGVTSNGMKGCSFKTLRDGVRAQIQHLKAYASREELVNGCVDPRYAYVEKGCAPYVEWLGQKENPKGKGWASGAKYGDKIKEILREMESQSTGKGQKDKNV